MAPSPPGRDRVGDMKAGKSGRKGEAPAARVVLMPLKEALVARSGTARRTMPAMVEASGQVAGEGGKSKSRGRDAATAPEVAARGGRSKTRGRETAKGAEEARSVARSKSTRRPEGGGDGAHHHRGGGMQEEAERFGGRWVEEGGEGGRSKSKGRWAEQEVEERSRTRGRWDSNGGGDRS